MAEEGEVGNCMTDNAFNWKKVSEEAYLAKGGFRKLLMRRFALPNGDEADFDITNTPRLALILAFVDDDHVLVVDQFRPGPEKVMAEVPGGFIEDGETPEHAAARELLEETGYEAETLEQTGMSSPDGYATTVKYCFVARGCKKVTEPSLDEHEFIQNRIVPFKEFVEIVHGGNSTGAVDALFHYFHYIGKLQ